MKFLKWGLSFTLLCTIAVVVARLLFPLPSQHARIESQALPANGKTILGRLMLSNQDSYPELSGVIPLVSGQGALGSRLALAASAEQSIDSQYYIWHDDLSGMLLLKSFYDAAMRGVRIRLLLDDNGVPGLDSTLASLNALPTFEIRLFNPSTVRSPKIAGYAFDFMRMNRRMHNKSFLVDGSAAIIGGRNVGDEYFMVGDDGVFIDLDVLASGEIVPETATAFDLYWNSESAYPIENIVKTAGDLDAFLARVESLVQLPGGVSLLASLSETVAERYLHGGVELEWTSVELLVDDPVKALGQAQNEQLMIFELARIFQGLKSHLDLVSAYFIPGDLATKFFAQLAGQDKSIRILTNALTTTDVSMVHAGYSKYRRELLESGVELFELKPIVGKTDSGSVSTRLPGVSSAGLHAKLFAIDDHRVFIGSFNFDPRSAKLNCEMGFMIESPTIARKIGKTFDVTLPLVTYKTELDSNQKLIWKELVSASADGTSKPASDAARSVVVHSSEPGASWFDKLALTVVGWLPIEWML